jgi:chorismate synthase
MRRIRLLTAGESHGPAVSGILEGLPFGLRVSTAKVDRDLRRRQHGYGSGRRMLIERDRVVWTAGLRFGRTLGSPLGFRIDNRDWSNWQDRMAVERPPAPGRPRPIRLARPGHADLPGVVKYGADDVRDVLERASARSTAPRVLAGAICRQLLATVGVRIWSYVEQLGRVRAFECADDTLAAVPSDWPARDLTTPTPLRCPDPAAEARMIDEVDAAAEAGDSVGGAFVVVAEGVPMGLGSSAEWDTRLDGQLAGAFMGIPAVKAVGLGIGAAVAGMRGSEVHDELASPALGWQRRSNRAGGIEGGMSNGMPIVVRAAVKPVSTLRRPLDSVDISTGAPGRAHIERSDIAIVPRAAIVGEAMAALVLTDGLLTAFAGDTVEDLRAAVRRRRIRERRPA